VRERGYEPELKSGVYIPFVQFTDTWALPESLVVRTAGDPVALTSAVRRIIAGVDAQQPVVAVRTMEETLDRTVEDRTQQMTLLGAFAGLALLLASIGIYGVLSYLVTQRRREIGVRMALGATSGTVIGMVLRRGLTLTGAGLAVGLVAAMLGTRAMKTMLYGVDAIDPATFGGVAAVLCAIAALACWVPAVRAARVDPIVVLRDE
jgi:ABC-type antimicrobial peptide transport system permease subunit